MKYLILTVLLVGCSISGQEVKIAECICGKVGSSIDSIEPDLHSALVLCGGSAIHIHKDSKCEEKK